MSNFMTKDAQLSELETVRAKYQDLWRKHPTDPAQRWQQLGIWLDMHMGNVTEDKRPLNTPSEES